MKRARRGVSAVEFAFAFPLLVAAVIGTYDFGRAMMSRSALKMATDEAGRHVMTHSSLTVDQIRTFLRSRTGTLDPNAVTVAVVDDVDAGVTFATITATTPFAFAGFLNLPPVTLRAVTRVPRAT